METTIVNEKIIDNFEEVNTELLQIKKQLCEVLGENKWGSEYVKKFNDCCLSVNVYLDIKPCWYEQFKDVDNNYFSRNYVHCSVSWLSAPDSYINACIMQAKHITDACQEVQKILEKYKNMLVWKFLFSQEHLDNIAHKQIVEKDKSRIKNLDFNRMRLGSIRHFDINVDESLVNTEFEFNVSANVSKTYNVSITSVNQVTVTRIS